MKIKVNADLFRTVYATVSTEETRYYLNGVHVEPHEKGAVLVSTDGHRAIIAHDPDGVCEEKAIIKLPRFALAQCKAPKMFEKKRVLEVENDDATIVEMTPDQKRKGEFTRENILTIHKSTIDGTFPDWRRVVPVMAKEPGMPGAVNPIFIRTWGEVGVELAKQYGGTGAVLFYSNDASSPMLVRFESAKNVFGIQMPMRSELTGKLPDFMSPPPPIQQAA